jgi:hypothetical protein
MPESLGTVFDINQSPNRASSSATNSPFPTKSVQFNVGEEIGERRAFQTDNQATVASENDNTITANLQSWRLFF